MSAVRKVAERLLRLWDSEGPGTEGRHEQIQAAYDDLRAALALPAPAPSEIARDAARTIYVASRASLPERAAMWRTYRQAGYPIISTWIDEDGPGQTASFAELWQRIEREIRSASAFVLYAEGGDFPLKGALVEAGIALALGKPIHLVLVDVKLDGRTDKPVGSWMQHPSVTVHPFVKSALDAAIEQERNA